MKQCIWCMYALSPVKSGDPCQEVQGSGLCHRPPVGLYSCGGLTASGFQPAPLQNREFGRSRSEGLFQL